MKKMYSKPVTTNLEVQTTSMVCTSTGMNNDPLNGSSNKIESGDAPTRGRRVMF